MSFFLTFRRLTNFENFFLAPLSISLYWKMSPLKLSFECVKIKKNAIRKLSIELFGHCYSKNYVFFFSKNGVFLEVCRVLGVELISSSEQNYIYGGFRLYNPKSFRLYNPNWNFFQVSDPIRVPKWKTPHFGLYNLK